MADGWELARALGGFQVHGKEEGGIRYGGIVGVDRAGVVDASLVGRLLLLMGPLVLGEVASDEFGQGKGGLVEGLWLCDAGFGLVHVVVVVLYRRQMSTAE